MESVGLLTKSLKDLYGIVKKIVKDEDGADVEPDVNALVAGWKADDIEDIRKKIAEAGENE